MTRRKEELDTMTTSDLGDLARKQIAEDILTNVREKRIGRGLLADNTVLQGTSGNQLEIMQRGSLNANPVGESEDITYDTFSYSTPETITVRKFDAASQISREAITDGREDVVDAAEEEIADALADMEDLVAIGCGLAGGSLKWREAGSDSSGDISVSNTPIFDVLQVRDTDNANTVVDPSTYSISSYENGIITGSGISKTGDKYDVTYISLSTMDTNGYITDANSNGSISPQTDLLDGLRKTIVGRKYTPDTLVLNDTKVSDILTHSDFIDESKYGDGKVLHDAELGKVFGMSVVISSQIPNKWVIAADTSKKPGEFVVKEDVRVMQKEKIDSDDLKIAAYQRYGAGLKKANAVQILDTDTTA